MTSYAFLPKAELHLHIEGTLGVDRLFQLAARHDVQLPWATEEEAQKARNFENLQSFLDQYYAACACLRERRDFYELADDYLRRAAADGVVRAEMFFDPRTHTARGVALDVVVGGLGDAIEQWAPRGVSAALILCFLRHEPADEAMRTLDDALALRETDARWRRHWIGVGLDSSERNFPPRLFADVYERARGTGLRCVAHAGEEGDASYVDEALALLKVERIDHGVRCLESAQTVAALVAAQTPLTVCPLSNVKLCVFASIEQHTLREMMRRGLNVTINSDDPAYFGGYINDNFAALALTDDEAAALAKNSLRAAFWPADEAERWCARVDEWRERRRAPPPPLRVVASLPLCDAARAALAASGADALLDITVAAGGDEPLRAAAAAGADALIVTTANRVDGALLDAAGAALRVVSTVSVGVDHIDLAACVARRICVAHTPDVLTETCADTTVMLMLGAARRVGAAIDAVRAGGGGAFDFYKHCGVDVHGARVLIVGGHGRIGGAVARRLSHGFACRVRLAGRGDALDTLLPAADFVVCCAALNDSTRRMFGAAQFAAMSRRAIFINVARGAVVDTDALVAALDASEIAGAGLDVTDPEPLPASHALLQARSNVLILPHMLSASFATRNAMYVLAIENLTRALFGWSDHVRQIK